MPRGDRSGPTGMGPRSGRAAGYCANYDTPGFMNRFFGRGPGMGSGQGRDFGNRGGGFGWRNMFHMTGKPGWMRFGWFSGQQVNPDPGTEKQVLKDQVDVLKLELGRMQQRLNDLESPASDK